MLTRAVMSLCLRQMKFNASKCYVLRITNKKKPVLHNYTMHDQVLENVDQNPYLGVQFTNTLKWDTHINNILAKANKSLGFLRRNTVSANSQKK